MKKALITGITGQDGTYLAALLLDKGYEVYGTSRNPSKSATNLKALNIDQSIQVLKLNLADSEMINQVMDKIRPDEIYHLAGQSSVGLSFKEPSSTFESIATSTLNLLENIRLHTPETRFFLACSSECFGETSEPVDENTPLTPQSPYAAAKASAYWLLSTYRKAYGLFLCSGFLFSHESPFRPPGFVTQKIVSSALNIASGSRETLNLGNVDVMRDWGLASEFVEAMWLMLQHDTPEDFVLATGQSNYLWEFVAAVFAHAGLDWKDHVQTNQDLIRPTDIMISRANTSKACNLLGWKAKSNMQQVAKLLIENHKTYNLQHKTYNSTKQVPK